MTKRVVIASGEVLKTALNAETLQSEWGVSPEPDMLYVTVRAISSRVNANYDGWPAEELEKSYKSFVGRGVYVEHNNWDPSRSRGVILGSKLHKSHLANGEKDYWIELLEEIDAKSFPKLAQAVLSGSLKSVSMGADVGFTVCSICQHQAEDPTEYCEHIAYSKGTHLVTGGQRKLVWEDCYDVGFFEISHVFDPADESADVLGKYLHTEGRVASKFVIRERAESLDNYYTRLKKVASKSTKIAEEMRLPERVETLRDESEDQEELSPVEMSDPDLDLDRETINEFKEYLDKIEENLDENQNDKENDMADEEFDPNDMDEEMDTEDTEDMDDEDMDDEDEDMEMEASRISKIRRRAGDLDVTYDNQTTMTTDGDYENASEMAPAAEAGATKVDTMTPDATEDVENLDASAVSGTPGQSEVSAKKQVKKMISRLKKRAEEISITDVENLDNNVATEEATVAPDMVADVTKPTTGDNQLALADRPDDIDDGTETGFSQASPPDTAKAFEDTNNNYVYEAAKKAARRQMMSAIEVYDLKEQLGLTDRKHRVAEIAKLENMNTRELVGYKKALLEVQSKTASNSKRVASRGTRFPEMGRSSKVSSRESDNLDDSLITL